MKTIPLISEIITELQKLFHQIENKEKLFSGWSKSVFWPKTVFFENVENIGKIKSGFRNYFHSPKIIFEKNPFSV